MLIMRKKKSLKKNQIKYPKKEPTEKKTPTEIENLKSNNKQFFEKKKNEKQNESEWRCPILFFFFSVNLRQNQYETNFHQFWS